MVDQLLEGLPRLVDLLVVDAVVIAEGLGVDVAVPLAVRQRRDGVQALVARLHLCRGERPLQMQIAAQVEEVGVVVGDHAPMVVSETARVNGPQRASGRSDPQSTKPGTVTP